MGYELISLAVIGLLVSAWFAMTPEARYEYRKWIWLIVALTVTTVLAWQATVRYTTCHPSIPIAYLEMSCT